MNKLDRFNTLLDNGFSKAIFDHLRNFLMCAFLLAIGTNEFKEHSSILADFVPQQYPGLGVIIVAFTLIMLNLYDGIRKISKSRRHLFIIFFLALFYVFFSVRVIEMAWDFRIVS